MRLTNSTFSRKSLPPAPAPPQTTPEPTSENCAAPENELLRGVRRVFAVAEAYPALKADVQFLRLQQELVNTEDRIQASRRFFNANVRDLNNRVESFPSSLVASMAGIGPAEFFEVEDLAIRAPAAMRF